MTKNQDLKLTSVKIHKDLLENFLVESIKDKLTLQKLVNRSIDMYLNDPKFKNAIENYNKLVTSGSI